MPNQEIPAGAIAGKYYIRDGRFTGEFYFSHDQIPEDGYDAEYSAEALYGIIGANAHNYKKVLKTLQEAVNYCDGCADTSGDRYIVKDLLNDVIMHQSDGKIT